MAARQIDSIDLTGDSSCDDEPPPDGIHKQPAKRARTSNGAPGGGAGAYAGGAGGAPKVIKFIVAGSAKEVLRVNTEKVTQSITDVCASAGIVAKYMTDVSSNTTVVIRFTADESHHQVLAAERFGKLVMTWLEFLNWLDTNYDIDSRGKYSMQQKEHFALNYIAAKFLCGCGSQLMVLTAFFEGGAKDKDGVVIANQGDRFLKCMEDAANNRWGRKALCYCASADTAIKQGKTAMQLWEAAGKPMHP